MKRKKIIFKIGQQEFEKININCQFKEYKAYIQKEEAFVKRYLKHHEKEFEQLMWEKWMYHTKKEIYAYQNGFIKGAKLIMEILME